MEFSGGPFLVRAALMFNVPTAEVTVGMYAAAVERTRQDTMPSRHEPPNDITKASGPGCSGGLGACPACGAVAGLRYEFSGSCGFVECMTCGATGPLDDKAADPICDIDAALQAWNQRTPIEGGCPWCGRVTNLHREGQAGERMHCGDCDACWPVAEARKP